MATRLFSVALLCAALYSCSGAGLQSTPSKDDIKKSISAGEFSEARKMIGLYITNDSLSEKEIMEISFERERMKRIEREFYKEDTAVVSYVKKYYPEAGSVEFDSWIKTNALENMVIDGKRRFFYAAGRNLFRIDSSAAHFYTESAGGQSDSLTRFLAHHIPQMVAESKTTNKSIFAPERMRIKYRVSVKPGEVPAGETIRVWLPYPRRDRASQNDIKLLWVSQPEYLISPDSYMHSSIYMEAKSNGDSETTFGYDLEYTSFTQLFKFTPEDVKPYDTTSALYKRYTAQRETHVIFSENIRKAVKDVVGDETNPYLKARRIFEWIDQNFPWASAREYSTIENIPEYVLANRHGDCGQVSLLFITMARCAGIPAKWQSGWMMHPGNKNLHDWAEAYFEGIGWVPVDQSFGRVKGSKGDDDAYYFFTKGLDRYRMIVNDDFSSDFYPAKMHFRSETVDFQRGEVEWRGGNLYFGRWSYSMNIEYL